MGILDGLELEDNKAENQQPITTLGKLQAAESKAQEDEKKGYDPSLLGLSEKEKANRLSRASRPGTEFLEEQEESDPMIGWGSDFTTMGNWKKAGRSLAAGVSDIFTQTGDVLEGALMVMGVEHDTKITDFLQNYGADMSEDYKVFTDPALEEMSMGELVTNPEFWSTSVARGVAPLIYQMLVMRGAGLIGGRVLGIAAQRTALTFGGVANVATTTGMQGGSRLLGALASKEANSIIGAISGGVTGNFWTGFLMASDAYKMAEEAGLSKEQQEFAAQDAFTGNLAWIALDVASYGLMFGKKTITPLVKASKIFDKAKPKLMGKIMRSAYKGGIRPLSTGLANSVEEQYQEAFEGWRTKRAVAKAKGEKIPDAWKDFNKYFKSQEAQQERAAGAALGFLSGAVPNAFNAIINREADVHDKMDIIYSIQKDPADEALREELIRKTMRDLAMDPSDASFANFAAKLLRKAPNQEQRAIIEEEIKEWQKELEKYEEALSNAERLADASNGKLNDAGKIVLFDALTKKIKIAKDVKKLEEKYKNDIESSQKTISNPKDLEKALNELEQDYYTNLENYVNEAAGWSTQIDNLIMGRKAEIKYDKFGNIETEPVKEDYVIDDEGNVDQEATYKNVRQRIIQEGLSEKDYKKFRTEEGQAEFDAAKTKRQQASGIFDKAKNKGKEVVEKVRSFVKDDTDTSGVLEKEPVAKQNDIPVDTFTFKGNTYTRNGDTFQRNGVTITAKEAVTAYNEGIQSKDFEAQGLKQKTFDETKQQSPIQNIKEAQIEEFELDGDKFEITSEAYLVTNKDGNTTEVSEEVMKEAYNRKVDQINKKGTRVSLGGVNMNANSADSIVNEISKRSKLLAELSPEERLANIREIVESYNTDNEFDSDLVAEMLAEQIVNIEGQNETFNNPKGTKNTEDYSDDPIDIGTPINKSETESESDREEKEKKTKKQTAEEREEAHQQKIKRNKLIAASNIAAQLNREYRDGTLMRYAESNIEAMHTDSVHFEYALQKYYFEKFPGVLFNVVRHQNNLLGGKRMAAALQGVIHIPLSSFLADDVSFYHEMAHVLYNTNQDNPEFKKLMTQLRRNKKLVDKVKLDYEEFIQYKFKKYPVGEDENGETIFGPMTITPNEVRFLIGDPTTENFEKYFKEAELEFTEAPMSEQEILNDELYVAYIQNDLRNNYNKFLTRVDDKTIKKDRWKALRWAKKNNKGKKSDNQPDIRKYIDSAIEAMEGGATSGNVRYMQSNDKPVENEINDPNMVTLSKMRVDETFEEEPSEMDSLIGSDLEQDEQSEENTYTANLYSKKHYGVPDTVSKYMARVVNNYNKVNKNKYMPITAEKMLLPIILMAQAEPTPESFVRAVKSSAGAVDIFSAALNKDYGDPRKADSVLRSIYAHFHQSVNEDPKILEQAEFTDADGNPYSESFLNAALSRKEQKISDRIFYNLIDQETVLKNDDKFKGDRELRKLADSMAKSLRATANASIADQRQNNAAMRILFGDRFDLDNMALYNTTILVSGKSVPISELPKTLLKNKILEIVSKDGLEYVRVANGQRGVYNNAIKNLIAANRRFTLDHTVNLANYHSTTAFNKPNQIRQRQREINRALANNTLARTTAEMQTSTFIDDDWFDIQFEGGQLEIEQFFGIRNKMTNTNQNYKDMSKNAMILTDLALFSEAFGGDGRYWQNLGTLGNSKKHYNIRLNSYRNTPKAKVEMYMADLEARGIATKKQLTNEVNEIVAMLQDGREDYQKNAGFSAYYRQDGTVSRSRVVDAVFSNVMNKYQAQQMMFGDIRKMKSMASPFIPLGVPYEIIPIDDEVLYIIDQVNEAIDKENYERMKKDKNAPKVKKIELTDGGTFVLPEDLNKIRGIYGPVDDIGFGVKMLHAGGQIDNPGLVSEKSKRADNAVVKSMTYSTDVLTTGISNPEQIAKMQKLVDFMRSRKTENSDHIVMLVPQNALKDGQILKQSSMSIDAIIADPDAANEAFDKLYYPEIKGVKTHKPFDGNNIGMQQVMERPHMTSLFPVQSVLATLQDVSVGDPNYDQALEIQKQVREITDLQVAKNMKPVIQIIEKVQSGKAITEKDFDSLYNYLSQRISGEELSVIQQYFGKVKAHLIPYNAKTMFNMLNNILRKNGNRIKTPGTISYQVSDIAFRSTDNNQPGELLSYQKENGIIYSDAIISFEQAMGMMGIKPGSKEESELAELVAMGNITKALENLEKENRFFIASRIPSHGLQTSLIFKVKGIYPPNTGEAISVPAEVKDIIGSDDDGDALYINYKTQGAKTKIGEKINKFIDNYARFWSSRPNQHSAGIDKTKYVYEALGIDPKNDEDAKVELEILKEEYTDKISRVGILGEGEKFAQSVPASNMIGQAANYNRLSMLLRAQKVTLKKTINLKGYVAKNRFENVGGEGIEGTAYQSQMLLNIILDNMNDQNAELLNINPATGNQWSLLLGMGFGFKQVAELMKHDGVLAWKKAFDNYNNPYNTVKSRDEIFKQALLYAGIKNPSSKKMNFNIDPNKKSTNIEDVIGLMQYLSEINDDLRPLIKIMAGHHRIDNNAFELQNQLDEVNNLLEGKSTTLGNMDLLKSNPDLQGYMNVANQSVQMQKALNPKFSKRAENTVNAFKGSIRGKKDISALSDDMQTLMASQYAERSSEGFEHFQRIVGPMGIGAQIQAEFARDMERGENIHLAKIFNVHQMFNGNWSITPTKDFAKTEWLTEEDLIAYRDVVARALTEQQIKDLIDYDLVVNGWEQKNSILAFVPRKYIEPIARGAMNEAKFNNQDRRTAEEKLAAIMQLGAANYDSLYKVNVKGIEKLPNQKARLLWTKSSQLKYYKFEELDSIFENQPTVFGDRGTEKSFQPTLYVIRPLEQDLFNNLIAEHSRNGVLDRNAFMKNVIQNNRLTIRRAGTELPLNTKGYKGKPKSWTKFALMSPPGKNGSMVNETGRMKDIARAAQTTNRSRNVRYMLKDGFNLSELTNELGENEYYKKKGIAKTPRSERAFKKYRENFKQAREWAQRNDVTKFSDEKISRIALKTGNQPVEEVAPILEKVLPELVRREALIQTNGEDYKVKGDITGIEKWLMSNSNFDQARPEAQRIVKLLNERMSQYERKVSEQIKEINTATENLYKSKLSKWKPIRFIQKLLPNSTFFKKIYEKLMVYEQRIGPEGTEEYRRILSLDEIKEKRNTGEISEAEAEFALMFHKYQDKFSKVLEQKGLIDKSISGYIPNVSGRIFEQWNQSGVFGLYNAISKTDLKMRKVRLKGYDPISDRIIEAEFGYFKDTYETQAKGAKNILRYSRLRSKANDLAKENKNEDGSPIEMSQIEIDTMLGMGYVDRFTKTYGAKVKGNETNDLNQVLVDFVRMSMFKHGDNETFEGFENLMPLVSGAIAVNQKEGNKNTVEILEKVVRQKRLMFQNQTSPLGRRADKAIDALNYVTLLTGLGFRVSSATMNFVVGKYNNFRSEGGSKFVKGEARFWGINGKTISKVNYNKARKILSKYNVTDQAYYHDIVPHTEKNTVKYHLENLALMVMTKSEDFIQGAHFLGLMTDEEWNKFDDEGNLKKGQIITDDRIEQLKRDVRKVQGQGYSTTDSRLISLYSIGRSMIMFKKFIPTQLRERFGKEVTNMYGEKEIGSMRKFGQVVLAVFNGDLKGKELDEYINSLPLHERKAFWTAVRGMGVVIALTAMGWAMGSGDDEDEESSMLSRKIAKVNKDINMYYHPIKTGRKVIIPYPFYTANDLGGVFDDSFADRTRIK